MYYELALISVLVAGGYWGWYFVRHDALRTYGLMLLAAAGLAGLGLLGRHYDEASLGIAGAIGVGAGACLLVLGPLARGLARRAAAAERFSIASKLLDIADVLAPGSGVADEKALLGAMREIRDGNIEHTIDALVAAKQRAPADARLAIDERIAMLYLSAYRWDDAIAHAEENLLGVVPPTGGAAQSGALRRALGIAPPVWVELLGAYGYTGDLDQAARMLARLEDVCAGREDGQIWLHRGRMMFLALAGRVDAVQTLVQPRRSRHMNPAARGYWVAVALERRGETAAAEAAYTKARSRSRGRPRVLIDQALARLADAADRPSSLGSEDALTDVRGVELGPDASELIARVEAAEPPTVAARTRPRGPIATRVLAGAVLAAAAAIALGIGDSSDPGVLVRSGALVRGLVHSGEWWRLVSCIFVHVGGVHLMVNVIGLWFLGRLAEDLLGGWRTACVFALAGLGGAVASFLASPVGVSAGASGAIFGLLGAVFVELTLHRNRHRTAWNRGVWGSLVVVTIAQLALDFVFPMSDQWAHGGGLCVGALAGALLSPHARWARPAAYIARAIAIAFAGATLAAAALVARTSVVDSLAREPIVDHRIGDLRIAAPATWVVQKGGVIEDPDSIVWLSAGRSDDSVAHLFAEAPKVLKDNLKAERVDIATDSIVPLPPGWDTKEFAITSIDPLGGEQHLRAIVAAHDGIAITLELPETLARQAPAFFSRLIGSIQ